MKINLPQKFPTIVGSLSEPTQEDIMSEPLFRRSTSSFVKEFGGPIAKSFLKKLEEAGLVSKNSRFLCQRSFFIKDMYPSSPTWHFDVTPGVTRTIEEQVNEDITSVIACVCSKDNISTTEFLSTGLLQIETSVLDKQEYKGGEYLNASVGKINPFHFDIEYGLSNGSFKKESLMPNILYKYDARTVHKAPKFTKTGGCRIVLRMTTVSDDFPHDIPISDVIIKED